jgi:Na+/melibiose symporter-like transporter
MFGISEGPSRGWGTPDIAAAILVGAALLAWLVRVELRTAQPLLQLRLFGNRLFRSASLVLMVAMASFLGVLFVVPLFFQIALGLSALQSGLNTFPEAIGVMVGAQLASRLLYPRVGPRRLMAVALVGVAASMLLMTRVGFGTNLWWMRLLMFVMGLAMSQVFISSQAAAFATVSSAETGYASSLFNSQRQLGSAVGVALLATVLAAVGTTHAVAGHPTADLTAYHAAFLTAAVVSLVAAALALTIDDADASVTMVRRRSRRKELRHDSEASALAHVKP